MKHRVEFSSPCSGQADSDEFGLPFRGTSPICGHVVTWSEDGSAQVSRASTIGRTFECCVTCGVYRGILTADGMYAEQYLELVDLLGLPPRSLREDMGHADDFTEFDFWLAWASGGGASAALAEAREHGYRLPAAN